MCAFSFSQNINEWSNERDTIRCIEALFVVMQYQMIQTNDTDFASSFSLIIFFFISIFLFPLWSTLIGCNKGVAVTLIIKLIIFSFAMLIISILINIQKEQTIRRDWPFSKRKRWRLLLLLLLDPLHMFAYDQYVNENEETNE